MIPKPLQFLLLVPLAFGPIAPRFFLGLFVLGLVGLALWWLRMVVDCCLVIDSQPRPRAIIAATPDRGRCFKTPFE